MPHDRKIFYYWNGKGKAPGSEWSKPGATHCIKTHWRTFGDLRPMGKYARANLYMTQHREALKDIK